jgi:hypothetical protein
MVHSMSENSDIEYGISSSLISHKKKPATLSGKSKVAGLDETTQTKTNLKGQAWGIQKPRLAYLQHGTRKELEKPTQLRAFIYKYP